MPSDDHIYVPGRFRCAKCKFQLSQMSPNMGDGTVTMDDAPSGKCPNDGSPMWRVSYREAYEELAADQNSEVWASMAIINRLVEDEGASLTILCENPEGNGADNHAVEVCDGWTDYEYRRFYGHTRFDALCKAEDARMASRQAESART